MDSGKPGEHRPSIRNGSGTIAPINTWVGCDSGSGGDDLEGHLIENSRIADGTSIPGVDQGSSHRMCSDGAERLDAGLKAGPRADGRRLIRIGPGLDQGWERGAFCGRLGSDQGGRMIHPSMLPP